MEDLAFNFLSKKENFLQSLPKNQKQKFSILNISDFLEESGLHPNNQNVFYEFIVELSNKRNFILEKGYLFIFNDTTIKKFLKDYKVKQKKKSTKTKKEISDFEQNDKKKARIILKSYFNNNDQNNIFLIKANEFLDKYDNMGTFPETIANVAYYQAHIILNSKLEKPLKSLLLSDKDNTLSKYWIKKFEKQYFNELYDIKKGEKLLNSIKTVGIFVFDDDFKKDVIYFLKSPLKHFFGININLALGLSILFVANLKNENLDYRLICKSLDINPSSLLEKLFRLLKPPIQFNHTFALKKNPTFNDFINSNHIRIGDHLTFNLNKSETDDAEILEDLNLKYHDIVMTKKEWAFEVKQIKNCIFTSNNFIFHRETRLSLHSILDLIYRNQIYKKQMKDYKLMKGKK